MQEKPPFSSYFDFFPNVWEGNTPSHTHPLRTLVLPSVLLEFPDIVVQALTDSDRYVLTSDQQWEQDNSPTRQFTDTGFGRQFTDIIEDISLHF